ncbi:MAG: crotonase [Archangium gephyra]|uniref:Crotonase n=1 Tax=Archangium gephyra TaxID=48 RepID=A0A2W5T566_9BACT|nr:MAG: crotonase [Archangium gephyra]
MSASLLISELHDGVRTLTISNPGKKNAIDAGLLDALEHALRDDTGVRCWLFDSKDPTVFCAGYDLLQLAAAPDGSFPDDRLADVLDLISRHPAPSVALINGPAYGGGCELAAACDFRVGSPQARFNMPPAKLGLVYTLKGLRRLSSRIGEQAARRMFLTARTVDAIEAHRIGLLDVLAADVRKEAEALCWELAHHAPLALAGIKRGFELMHLDHDADYERLRRQAFESEDLRRGRDGFLSKKPPTFTGR